MSARFSDRATLFVTPRLAVRHYRPDDRPVHLRLRADPAVRRFMHWPDDEDFERILADAAGRRPPDTQGWINLALVDQETGAVAGDHGLRVERDTAWIGLALLPEWRRAGLGRELVRGSMLWLRRHGCRLIRAEIDFGNEASFKLFLGLGFRVIADRQDAFGPFSLLERATR